MLLKLQQHLDPSAWLIIILIFGIFGAAFLVNLIVRKKYITLQNDLDNRAHRRSGRYDSTVLNKIVEDFKSASMGNYNEVNTQAIIEKCFNQELRALNMAERFIKQAVSLLIVLGLLGTFLGLTIAVEELVKLLGTTSTTTIMNDFSSIIGALLSAVSGMAVAFITSLVGIGCSIILTVLNVIYNVEEERETLMVHIEEYLDNTVALVLSKDKQTEYTMMNNILRNTFVEFGEKIEMTLQNTVENFGQKLSHVVMEVDLSSKTLDNTIDKFDQSLKNFAHNIRDFSEFNFNLRNNIERMDVSFIKVAEAISSTSKIIEQNYDVIHNFSENIRDAASDITTYNRQVVQDIGSLVNEVRESVTSIKELGQLLDNSTSLREKDIQQYQNKVNELTQKLGKEVTLLSEKAAETLSTILDESGKLITQSMIDNSKSMSQSIVEEVKGVIGELYAVMQTFSDNEKMLAKTITILPDQILTYSEAAMTKIDKQLCDLQK